LDDPAVLDDHQPVGEHHRVQRIVGDQQSAALVPGEVLAEFGAHVERRTGVQGGQWFVQQEYVGFGGEGADQRDALGLAAGQGPWSAARLVGQPHGVQPLRRLGAGEALVHATSAQPERDVLQRAQVVEQQVVLKHDTDRPTIGRTKHPRRLVPHLVVEADPPAGDGQQARDRAQCGGLAGAVRAEQCDHLAWLDGQLQVELEGVPGHGQFGVQGHRRPLIQRSRRQARTTTDTASRTTLSTTATSGSVSNAR
jgi:hypothetical protein